MRALAVAAAAPWLCGLPIGTGWGSFTALLAYNPGLVRRTTAMCPLSGGSMPQGLGMRDNHRNRGSITLVR